MQAPSMDRSQNLGTGMQLSIAATQMLTVHRITTMPMTYMPKSIHLMENKRLYRAKMDSLMNITLAV